MKRALVIRHTPLEGIAGFRAPIEAAGYEVVPVPFDALGGIGALALTADLLVTMGGPMGVYERDRHRWIEDEIAILAARIAAGGPTLGVCLGAQLIAAALGARVYPGPDKEIGFAPVALDAVAGSPLAPLGDVPVLHWHGDTFDLPDGAERLASTPLYPQAFRIGAHVLALQCHPEMGEDPRIEGWIADDPGYLARAGVEADALRDDYRRLGPAAVAAGREMLARWLAALT